jgi:Aromatic acid exporter family member 1
MDSVTLGHGIPATGVVLGVSVRPRLLDVTRQARARLLRRGRTPGVRTSKTVLAAVLSFALATALHTSDQPILAPLTALLVVQLTMYETVAHGWERILSVTAGVSVAAVFAHIVGLNWWSLGAVVTVSLIAGRLLRLGPHLPEVAISAMLVLAVGGGEPAAAQRVVETLIGAAVGILINLVLAPPLYIQPAGDAVAELADGMGRYCSHLAAALRGSWSRGAADQHLDEARKMGDEVTRAERRLARAEQSARLNPRARQIVQVQPRLRNALTALEHGQIGLRNLSRALLDRTYYLPPELADQAYPPATRDAIADVLDAVAAAVHGVAPIAAGHHTDDTASLEAVAGHLSELGRRTERLGALLYVDPHVDPAAWQQHGALLAAIDRLRVEIDAAIRRPGGTWRPAALGERQRDALRRGLTAARDHRHPLRGRALRERLGFAAPASRPRDDDGPPHV